MMRSLALLFAVLCLALPAALRAQEQRRTSIDVDHYKIEAQIDLERQTLQATAAVTFLPLDSGSSSATFELHNALSVSKVVDDQGRSLETNRSAQDYTLKVFFLEPLVKNKPMTVIFTYGGRLSGQEESPIPGIQFAVIGKDASWLLYPSRWFPLSGYTSDRYTMDLSVQVPTGYRVLSSGIDSSQGNTYTFKTIKPGFPGSLAVVQGTPAKVSAEGLTNDVWFRGAQQASAQAWGDGAAKAMVFLTSLFGVPPQASLTIVQTGEGAPNGYSALGMLFVSSAAASKPPSPRLLANQITRQWFGNLLSPINRNHIWLCNGFARYAEVLYLENLNGPQSVEPEVHDLYVDALTVTDAPVRQAARFEDYSPEFFAVTGSKGAATLHMLRWIVGDDNFKKMLRTFVDQSAGKSVSTDDFRKVAENISGQPLQGFFIQWLESTGAPEFKKEYTVFRISKGFRTVGKITQDLDTFRMPVEIKIETEGNPEFKKIDVSGPTTEFSVETFGKPKRLLIDPNSRLLTNSSKMRVDVAIRRGEQFAEINDYSEALKQYQQALGVNRISSLAHYRVGEVFFLQGNYQSAANEFRESLNGDGEPRWTEVWSHINLGKIYDVTQQRDRARNEYQQAIRTKDNTQGAQEQAAKYIQTPYQRKDTN
ncbi:MAG: M1 family aminopeptidase [Bryobacteraceae bacterium]